jgi:hypothetical protein
MQIARWGLTVTQPSGLRTLQTWRQHSVDLDERLHIIEIADPDEPAG